MHQKLKNKFNQFANSNIHALQFYQLLRFGTLLLISVFFAKSSLTTGEIGEYEMFLFIAGLVCTFWLSGLIQSFLPLYNSEKQKSKAKDNLFFNAFVLIFSLSGLVVLLLIAFKYLLQPFFESATKIPYFEHLLLYILFSTPAFLIEYIFLLKDRPKSIYFYGIVSFLLHFVLVVAPVFINFSLTHSLSGLVSISLLRFVFLLFLLKKYSVFRISIRFIKTHATLGLPLVASLLLSSSAQYIDGFLVLHYFDTETFAIFRYGAKELPLVMLMANAFSNAMMPEFSKGRDTKEVLAQIKRQSLKMMHLLFPLTIILLLASSCLYPVVFNDSFGASSGVFNIYLFLIISRLVFPNTILIGLKQNRSILWASSTELVVNFVSSIILIQIAGIEGVAIATVIAYIYEKVYLSVVCKRRYNFLLSDYIPVKVLIIYTLLLILVYAVQFVW